MLGTLAHAVVHVVALRRNYPLVPLDILEFDVKVFLAADRDVFATVQRALPDGVLGAIVTQADLGHHERLVGRVGGAVQRAEVPPVFFTADLEPQAPFTSIQERLERAGDGECVPVTLLDVQHLFYHQGAVGV